MFKQYFGLFLSKLNPFSTNVPLLYPLKTYKNLQFSVFRGYGSGTLVEHGFSKPACKSHKLQHLLTPLDFIIIGVVLISLNRYLHKEKENGFRSNIFLSPFSMPRLMF